MSLLVLFPVGKEAGADTYLTACNAAWKIVSPGDDNWYPNDTVDVHGQRYVGYLGPGGAVWNGQPFVETPECAVSRSDGALVEAVDMPELE